MLCRAKTARHILSKLDLTWEGLVKVTKFARLRLKDLNGKPLPHLWNSNNLHKFYC